MSLFYTISFVLSLISLLTTILTLIRFGSIQYAANQLLAAQSGCEQGSTTETTTASAVGGGGGGGGVGGVLSRFFFSPHDKNIIITGEGAVGFIDEKDIARLPVNWIFRKPFFDQPLAPLKNLRLPTTTTSHKTVPPPVSMAKLIMSRHAQKRPPRLPRRSTTPGALPSAAPTSRLIEEV